jgi:hypothetical protein
MATPFVLTSAVLALAVMVPALGQDQSPDAAETGAAAPSDQPLTAMPSYREPAVAWNTVDDPDVETAICRDRIHKAREEAGQPPLDREPATGDEPMAIWAVDRREDGCAMLVAMGDAEDIRPIPRIEENHLLRPAN